MSVHFPYLLALFTIISVRGGRVLLALFAIRLEAPDFLVGLLAGTFSLAPMLMAYQIGKLSDRYGTRWPLTVGIVGSMAGILVPALSPTLPALFVAALLNGVAFAFFNVSLQNTVGLLSTPDTRVRNFAHFTLVVSVAQFVAPVIVGFGVDHAGPRLSCALVAAFAAIPVVMLALRGGGLPAGTGKPAAKGGYDLFFYYLPIYTHALGLSASVTGIILGIFSGAGLLVRLALPHLIARLGNEGVLAASFLASAACYLLFPLVHQAWLLCVLAFACGLVMSVGQPITMALSFSNASDGRSGAAMGLRQTVNHFTRVSGPLLFGSIGSLLGPFGVFWINAAMLAAGASLSKKGKLGDPAAH